MNGPIPKDGHVESPTFLAWVRRQPCWACVELRCPPRFGFNVPPCSEAHHYPTKGSARWGDDSVIPLCRDHHRAAQEYQLPYTADFQEGLVRDTRWRFIEQASVDELRAYFQDLITHRERPMAIPF